MVIADWLMHPLDGLDFTRIVRTADDSKRPQTPIILMTGHTERENVVHARDAGVTEILAKPISARSLHDRIISVIINPRPFVLCQSYTGPCRRRQIVGTYAGPERRIG